MNGKATVMPDVKPGVCIECGTKFQRKKPKGPMPKRCGICKTAYQAEYKRKWFRNKYATDEKYRAWRKEYDRKRRERDPDYNRRMTAAWRARNADRVREYNENRRQVSVDSDE